MRSQFQADVICPDIREPLLHDALGQLRFVALAAQVAEVEMLQPVGHNVRRAIGRGLVREMAVPAENALLQTPRPPWAILQHFHVMIRFQHQRMGVANPFGDEPRHVAKISGETKIGRRCAQEKANRILRIMRNGEGLDRDVADLKRAPGYEEAEFRLHAEDALDFLHRRAIAVNRDAQFVRQSRQAGNVVAVLVRDKDGVQILRRPADAGEALADLPQAETGIDQHPRLVGFDVGAVAGRTAAENREFDGHAKTLKCSEWSGNEIERSFAFRPRRARFRSTEPGSLLNAMKRSLLSFAFVIALLPVLPAHADLLDKVRSLAGGTNQPALAGALSQTEVVDGLKQALGKGVERAVAMLGRTNGFLTNLNVKIPLPEKLRSAEKALRAVGQEELADDFVASMNRAAEQAVPVAAGVFGEAIKQMTIEDAKGILSGTNNAATQFFRRTTQTNLYAKFLPIVQKATDSVGVTQQYKQMMAKVGGGGALGGLFGGKSKEPMAAGDLDAYVTNKALDGLFLMVAEEEKRIRENPAARTTELLKKVFGGGSK